MGKKLVLTALAVLAFVPVPRSNAGTEIIEPYNAPTPNYTYAPPPPPRPVYYVPPPVFGVAVAPAYAYGYFGPRFAYYHSHRFLVRRGLWHFHRHY